MQAPLSISSCAMWSSWCLYRPASILFDCGDGVAQQLRSQLFTVDLICLSHQCWDHIGGLVALVGIRSKVPGRERKPLTVLYPAGSRRIERLITLIHDEYPDPGYALTFTPISPGYSHDLGRSHTLHAFETKHRVDTPSLGYRIDAHRRKLRPDLAAQIVDGAIDGVPVSQLFIEMKARGESIHVNTDVRELAYTLDNHDYDPIHIQNCHTVVADSTFIVDADRKMEDPAHATLTEVVSRCHAAGVKQVVLAHISTRYAEDTITAAVDAAQGTCPPMHLITVYPDRAPVMVSLG